MLKKKLKKKKKKKRLVLMDRVCTKRNKYFLMERTLKYKEKGRG